MASWHKESDVWEWPKAARVIIAVVVVLWLITGLFAWLLWTVVT